MHLKRTKNLSDEKIKNAIDNVKATLAFEGMNLTESEIAVLRDYFEGKCTADEMVSKMRNL